MKFCNNCKQFVEPKKDFNWCAFLVLLIFFGLGIFYLIYYLMKKGKCPQCNSQNWGVPPSSNSQAQNQSKISEPIKTYQFCSACGNQIDKGSEFCKFCGSRQ